jgi:hypothetical protein
MPLVAKNPRKPDDALTALRRRKLAIWIKDIHHENKTAFSRAVGKPRNQIVDMLRPNSSKSFGARIAREFEQKSGMKPYYLDTDNDAPPVKPASSGWPFHFPRDDYDRLAPFHQQRIADFVAGMIQGFLSEVPAGAKSKAKGR